MFLYNSLIYERLTSPSNLQYNSCLFITVVFDNLINVLFDVLRHERYLFRKDK